MAVRKRRSIRIGPALALLALTPSCASRAPESGASALPAAALLPTTVRRLTAHEYDRTVSDLLGFEAEPSTTFAPDVRQNGFTPNVSATVDAVFESQLHQAATALAARATSERLSALVPCSLDANAECAADFIADFGQRAFRRALSDDERARYLALYNAGLAGGDFQSGIALVLGTLLESPNLMYLTELGANVGSAATELTPSETASLLAFGVSGSPPDAELLAAAESGALAGPEAREAQARRLLRASNTRFQFRRFVAEWLGLDQLANLAKDSQNFPDFPSLRGFMQQESDDFVDHVMIFDGGSLSALLASGKSVVPPELRAFYGVGAPQADGTTSLLEVGRAGLLQQASFLAVHGHPGDSAPVLRGATVLRRVLCEDLPSPFDSGVEIVLPPADPTLTTRARFAAHATNRTCAACHDSIDAVGFTFENFDAVGRSRSSEAGQPIDTRGGLTDESGSTPLADSVALARALARDPQAESCLARQVFRYVSGRNLPASEDSFVTLVGALPEATRSSVLELVVAFVKSELFVRRSQQ